jgi:hypothetical protein
MAGVPIRVPRPSPGLPGDPIAAPGVPACVRDAAIAVRGGSIGLPATSAPTPVGSIPTPDGSIGIPADPLPVPADSIGMSDASIRIPCGSIRIAAASSATRVRPIRVPLDPIQVRVDGSHVRVYGTEVGVYGADVGDDGFLGASNGLLVGNDPLQLGFHARQVAVGAVLLPAGRSRPAGTGRVLGSAGPRPGKSRSVQPNSDRLGHGGPTGFAVGPGRSVLETPARPFGTRPGIRGRVECRSRYVVQRPSPRHSPCPLPLALTPQDPHSQVLPEAPHQSHVLESE